MTRLLGVLPLMACASWAPMENVLAGTALTAIAGDCAITMSLVRDTAFFEGNPAIRGVRDPAIVGGVCALGALATVAVADALPRVPRRLWLAGVTVLEFVVIGHNLNLWTLQLWPAP